jgi:hypothetical protein
LQTAELGSFLFAAADQASFLKLQVAELLFVDQMCLQLDETAANVRVLLSELIRVYDAAAGVDRHFEPRNAA